MMVPTGQWNELFKLLEPMKRKNDEIRRGLLAIGYYFKGEVKSRIKTRAYKANHPFTILLKSTSAGIGDQPLVDTGQLNKSIACKPDEFDGHPGVFVGVLRTSRAKGGAPLVKVAEIVHEGMVIQVTDKMRFFLHRHGVHLKPDTKTIVIPPRQFIRAPLQDPAVRAKIEKMYLMMTWRALKAGTGMA